jgi:hypothetical protein
MRHLAGNGSVQLGGIYKPLIPLRKRQKQVPTPTNTADRMGTSLNPFILLAYPDVDLTLVFTGIVYAVNYTITTTIASSYAKVYPWLSEMALGLCYLPTGFGMIVGSTLTGKLLDWEYARVKRRFADVDEDDISFPKEYARLRTMPLHLVIFTLCVFGWGFCIQYSAPIAVPLILQVICKFVLNFSQQIN